MYKQARIMKDVGTVRNKSFLMCSLVSFYCSGFFLANNRMSHVNSDPGRFMLGAK